MVRSFKFSIIRLAPEGVRDERINVGAVVFDEHSVDVRLPKRLDKIRVISAAIDQATIKDLVEAIEVRDIDLRHAGIADPAGRRDAIGRVGPLVLSPVGAFTCSNEREYEHRIDAIFRSIIEPEPAPKKALSKRSRLLSQLKQALREERVLAKGDENLESHRVVADLELAEGLVADLVLKNGAMHVFETVDASSAETSLRKAVSDIAVSALVLEQARIKFGERHTKTRLIYHASSAVEGAARFSLEAAEHQGAELINWASNSDKIKLVTSIASLAVPLETARERAKRLSAGDHPRLRLA